MFRLALTSIFIACCLPVGAEPSLREAPNRAATPANQLLVSGNACGPAALLNAFRFGNEDWQRASYALSGATDKQQIYTIIREYGMRPSKSITGRPRWSRKGVNLADLCDIGNEIKQPHLLPTLGQEVLFRTARESQEKLLLRAQRRLEASLARGFPPVISLRRYAFRRREGKAPEWTVIDAHFVTITAVPRKLVAGVRSFSVRYIDPWGGKLAEGVVSIPSRGLLADLAWDSPCLEVIFPQASVGKKLLREGEYSVLALAAVLGKW
jgi:hypothetical protein